MRPCSSRPLTLAASRADGTPRPPVTMWVVRDGEDVYVRSVNGHGSARFGAKLVPRDATTTDA